ncbi:hypothetical protein DFH09DRAFT_1199884 [Mycena vulgaris]|nr:hypothetical protein DFH09DRAFT_1199884 [Mycena vulgaris]
MWLALSRPILFRSIPCACHLIWLVHQIAPAPECHVHPLHKGDRAERAPSLDAHSASATKLPSLSSYDAATHTRLRRGRALSRLSKPLSPCPRIPRDALGYTDSHHDPQYAGRVPRPAAFQNHFEKKCLPGHGSRPRYRCRAA